MTQQDAAQREAFEKIIAKMRGYISRADYLEPEARIAEFANQLVAWQAALDSGKAKDVGEVAQWQWFGERKNWRGECVDTGPRWHNAAGEQDALRHVQGTGPIRALYLQPTPQQAGEDDSILVDALKYRALNTPEIHDFLLAVEREALHQRDRWGVEHDAGKADSDWFWLIGYLAGKAIHKPEKSLHHIITTAAACLNWHAAKLGAHNAMRPGIAGEAAVIRPKPNDTPPTERKS